MKRHLHRMGILTDSTVKKIDRIHDGVVETGQQPNCLGGPSLILNKIVYAESLAEQAGKISLFYVVDYDGVKHELTNTRLPSPSPNGLSISYPVSSDMNKGPINALNNPPEEWLKNTLEKIENNYRGLLKGTSEREKVLQNIRHAFALIKTAFYSTDNVSNFSTRLIGTLVNLEADLAVPIYWHSMPDTRHLFQKGYETLLAEPNRSRFIEATNKAAEVVETSGYRSQIGLRSEDFVPFYLECIECNKARIKLTYSKSPGSPSANVSGECLNCGAKYDFSFNAKSPDLTEIINHVSPRVDTRQIIVNSVIPVLARVGGPGETSYFAEVIPAIKALKLPLPLFMRYTRIFYNTPWNESKATSLECKGYTPLANIKLFNALGRWVKSKKTGDSKKLTLAHREIQYSIASSYRNLLTSLRSLEAEIDTMKQKLRGTKERSVLVKEIREKQKITQEIKIYLSWAYGRFTPDKYGQEVNWNWLDLAVVTGVTSVLDVYKRLYNENTPNASMYYVNL